MLDNCKAVGHIKIMAKKPKNIIKRISWDIFIGFIFSGQGVAILSVLGAAGMTWLAIETPEFEAFAPFSYGAAFLISLVVVYLIFSLFKKLREPKFYTGGTHLIFQYDGESVYQEERKNIWGWRGIFMSHVIDAKAEKAVATRWLFAICFKEDISPDNVRFAYRGAGGDKRIPCDLVNFETRTANIKVNLAEHGTYIIEFKHHEN